MTIATALQRAVVGLHVLSVNIALAANLHPSVAAEMMRGIRGDHRCQTQGGFLAFIYVCSTSSRSQTGLVASLGNIYSIYICIDIYIYLFIDVYINIFTVKLFYLAASLYLLGKAG